ncbi:MAG: hypothetical protein WBG70_23475 [Spirulinaceae cyanobacterium]
MRLSSLTLYTLTALIAGGKAVQANENISVPDLAEEPETPVDLIAEDDTNEISEVVMPQTEVLPPENQLAQVEFSSPKTATQPVELAQLPSLNTSTQAEELKAETIIPETITPEETPLVAETSENCNASHSNNSEQFEEIASTQLLAQKRFQRCPRPLEVEPLEAPEFDAFAASPALSIYIPVGYGADRNTIFTSHSYQSAVRVDDGSVYSAGVGVGLGDADKAVGVELSYALDTNNAFGDGGFNTKVHKRFGNDWSGALGWNGLLNTSRNDFEQSFYGALTKVFRTQPSLNDSFSRVSVTAGLGDGQFRSNGAVAVGDNNINAFGNVAVRVARPVSLIAEWTGQDLGLGVSIAPFKNIPIVVTPAFRDVAGAGDKPRFVLGLGAAWRL